MHMTEEQKCMYSLN